MKRVKIAELEDQLSRHLRAVENGAERQGVERDIDSSVLLRVVLGRTGTAEDSFATHDHELAVAAKAVGLRVHG